jgi:hypothetical protein
MDSRGVRDALPYTGTATILSTSQVHRGCAGPAPEAPLAETESISASVGEQNRGPDAPQAGSSCRSYLTAAVSGAMMGQFVDYFHGNGRTSSDLADAAEEPREWRIRL